MTESDSNGHREVLGRLKMRCLNILKSDESWKGLDEEWLGTQQHPVDGKRNAITNGSTQNHISFLPCPRLKRCELWMTCGGSLWDVGHRQLTFWEAETLKLCERRRRAEGMLRWAWQVAQAREELDQAGLWAFR